MNCFGQPFDRLELSEKIGSLNDESGGVLIEQGCQAVDAGGRIFVTDDCRGIRSAQVGLDYLPILGMDGRRDDDLIAPALPDIDCEQHGFCQSRCAVIVTGIAHIHAGQPADHALIFEQGLQHALADLRLILRIGRGELAAGKHVIDGCRPEALIGACA